MSWKIQEGLGISEFFPYIPPGTVWVPWRPLHGQEMCVWLGHHGRIAELRPLRGNRMVLDKIFS